MSTGSRLPESDSALVVKLRSAIASITTLAEPFVDGQCSRDDYEVDALTCQESDLGGLSWCDACALSAELERAGRL
jgi:hypothetical protein